MKITELDVKRQMRRLAAVYKPPADAEAAMDVWMNVLRDVSPTELMTAVGKYLADDNHFFPKPGRIRMLAMQERRLEYQPTEYHTEPDHNPGIECANCGAKLRVLRGSELNDNLYQVADDVEAFGILHRLPCEPGRVT